MSQLNSPDCKIFNDEFNVCTEQKPCDALILEAMSEAWFSNQLAWLLDPKGSHNLGKLFLQLFLKKIGMWRTAQKGNDRKATYLKVGKSGTGVGVTNFKLSNCSVLREFLLSHKKSKQRKTDNLFCDLVVADLDTKDGLFVVIENKLFTTDHLGQLDDYEEIVNLKFSRAKVREFVYLTLTGEDSKYSNKNDHWVKLSWLTDIKDILAECIKRQINSCSTHQSLNDLLGLLIWMENAVTLVLSRKKYWSDFEKWMKKTSGDLLLEELNRLGNNGNGKWSWCDRKNSSFTLEHSRFPTIKLHIGLATGLVVTLQLRRHGPNKKILSGKHLIPFGTHPNQVINLIDIIARDILNFLPGKTENYLSDRRRLKNHAPDRDVAIVLKNIYFHRYELPLLLKIHTRF